MQKFNKYILIILALFLLIVPLGIFAADPPEGEASICNQEKEICNPIRYNTINGFIKAILEGIIKIGIPIIALAIIYSGFLFVTAQGSSEKLGKAKDALLWSIVGAALVLGAWALAILISETVLKFNP